MERCGGTENKILKNQGFSLVEVLVCVAILAIICVPLFQSFGTSALLNNEAHYIQKTTAYAQAEMETVKSVSLSQYEALVEGYTDGDGNNSGTVTVGTIDTGLQSQFPADYPEELFRMVDCTRDNIRIGSKLYRMSVRINPIPYSQPGGGTEEAALTGDASDANVFGVIEVAQADSMHFPVISTEINQFEAGGDGPGAAIHNLLGQIKESELSAYGYSEADRLRTVYDRTGKSVEVTIKNIGSDSINVSCDVTYELSGTDIRLTYHVYSGTYQLKADTTGGSFVKWDSGGNIFIFAKAYADPCYGGTTAPLENRIEIKNEYTGEYPISVYLVRGYHYEKDGTGNFINKRGTNFDSVTVGGTSYYSGLPYGGADLSGELSKEATDGKTHFYTNIKGKPGKILTEEEMEAAVGTGSGGLRCMEITVTMQEQTTEGMGEIVTQITSTKAT